MAFPLYVFDGDRDHAQTLIPHANKVLHQVREFLSRNGGGVFSLDRPIPGGYCRALKIGDTEHVYIYADPVVTGREKVGDELVGILSGVTRGGSIIAGSPDVLRDFRPTQQAWVYALKSDPAKNPSIWHDEARLAIGVHPDLGLPGESQYQNLCPSMYTGRMAKLVQLLLGYGKLKFRDSDDTMKAVGVKVRYDFRWGRTHGLHLGPDGTVWLVEVSVSNGVIAMPLPVFPSTKKGASGSIWGAMKSSGQNVLREAAVLFNGLPTGAIFPTGAALTAAIEAGTILRLRTTTQMLEFHGKSAYTSASGWSFNQAGSTAHNTCYHHDGTVYQGSHYALHIYIGPLISDREPGDPIAEASASLELVHRSRIVRNSGTPVPFRFWEPMSGGWAPVPASAPSLPSDELYSDVRLLVLHRNDALTTVNYYWTGITRPLTQTGQFCSPINPNKEWTFQRIYYPQQPLIYSTEFSEEGIGYTSETTTANFVQVSLQTGHFPGDALQQFQYVGRIDSVTTFKVYGRSAGLMPEGSRDAYVLFQQRSRTLTSTLTQYKEYLYFNPVLYSFSFHHFDEEGEEWWEITRSFATVSNVPCPYPILPREFLPIGVHRLTSIQNMIRLLPRFKPITKPVDPSGVTTDVYSDPTLYIVRGEGDIISLAKDHSTYDDESWFDPSTAPASRFSVRASMMGSQRHLAYSQDVGDTLQVATSGSMFAGEPLPSNKLYSFLGYIP